MLDGPVTSDMSPRPILAGRRLLLAGVKIAVSGLLIWYILNTNDLDAVSRNLGEISVDAIFLALLILCLSVAVISLRWMVILRGIGIRLAFIPALHIVFIGVFFNQVLPSTVGGDAIRTWRLFKAGVALGAGFRSVVLDRVAALAGLVLMLALSLPFVSIVSADAAASWSLAGLVACAIGGMALLLSFDKIPLPPRYKGSFSALDALAVDARRLFFTPSLAAPSLSLSVVVQVGSAMTVFILADGMKIEIGMLDSLVLVPPVLLLSVLPISIAGWGVREGAMITALGFVGVASAEALALSLVFGLVLLAFSLPGGVLWFIQSRPVDARESTGA